LTITQAVSQLSWAPLEPVVYGTPLSDVQLNARSSHPGTFTYLPAAATVLKPGSYPLKAVFVPADAANVAGGEVTTLLTVTSGPLVVGVKDVTRKQGQANPAFEITYQGFVGSDTPATLTKRPTAATSAEASSPGGRYPIIVGGGESKDYVLSYLPGLLVVENGAPTLSKIGDQTIAQGAVATLVFNIGDPETPAEDLLVTATASNPKLVVASELRVGGSGPQRSLSITPVSGESGTSEITVTVSDRTTVTPGTFTLKVEASSGSQTGLTGVAQDGYVAGALVFFDANGNRAHDSNEPSTLTDDGGKFNLSVDLSKFDLNKNGSLDPSEGSLVMLGGVDIATGVRQTSALTAPAGSTVITPLTTLLTAVLDASPSIGVAEAERRLGAALGLPSQVSVTSYDAIAGAANNDAAALQVLNVAAKVQDTTALGSAVLSSGGQSSDSAAKSVTSALASAVLSSTPVDLSNGKTTRDLLSSAATRSGTVLSEALLNTASEIVSSVNQAKDSAATGSGNAAQSAIEVSRVQGVAQGRVAQDLARAASGESSVDDVASLNSGAALRATISNAPVGVLLAPTTIQTGQISLSASTYQVGEDGTGLRPIVIHRKGGSSGVIRGVITLTPGENVLSTGDFTTNRLSFVMGDKELSKTIDLSDITVNDTRAEGEELYTVSLDVADPSTRSSLLGSSTSAELHIIDDESVGVFEFVSSRFSVSESGASTDPVTIRRAGGSSGSVELKVELVGATGGAVAGKDFSESSVVVSIPEGVMSKRVILPLVNDDHVEPTETLQLKLSVQKISLDAAATPNDLQVLGGLTVAEVTVQDDDVNHAPVAVGDSITATQGQPLIFSVSTLLTNDSDVDLEDSLKVDGVDNASAAGALVALNAGQLLYIPPARLSGTDRFSYVVADRFGGRTQGTVTVTVVKVNAAPVAAPDQIVLSTPSSVVEIQASDLLLNDYDSEAGSVLKVASVSSASEKGGKVSLTTGGQADRLSVVFFGNERWTNTLSGALIRYTPPAGLEGADTFTYRVVDPEGKSAEAKVTVRVNTAPSITAPGPQGAVGDRSTSPIPFRVADSETAASDLVVQATSSNPSVLTSSGISFLNRGETRFIALTPVSGATGVTTVTLTVTDPQGASATAQFELTVSRKGIESDIDGDGKLDLVLHHRDGYLGVWSIDHHRVTGAKFLDPIQIEDKAWKPVVSTDLDGDGRNDLIFQHTDGSVGYWTLNGIRRVNSGLFEPSNIGKDGWRIVGAADFNGDKKSDLLLQHKDGLLGAWLMDGTQVVGTAFLEPSVIQDVKWAVAGVADLDHDGQSDILFQHEDGSLGVWFMNGLVQRSAKFTTPSTPGDAAWRARSLLDVSGDGHADIVFQHTDGTVALWTLGGADGTELIEAMLFEPFSPGDGWTIMSTQP